MAHSFHQNDFIFHGYLVTCEFLTGMVSAGIRFE